MKRELGFVLVMCTIEKGSSFCSSHVHYRNVMYFLYFWYTVLKCEVFPFFSCTLSKREVVFLFVVHTIETGSIFYFSYVHYGNLKYCLFLSGTLWKREIVFVFLMYAMYTIIRWSSFRFLKYTIETWRVFVFLMYTIERWSIFCFSHVHIQNSKPQAVFVLLMYPIETWCIFCFFLYTIVTWSVSYFSHVHIQNLMQFLFFSCTLSNYEVFFVFLIILSNCEIFFVFVMYTI